MVQEAGNAPFNDEHSGWILPGNAAARFWTAEGGAGARQIALEYSAGGRFGVVFASDDGTLGGVDGAAVLPAGCGGMHATCRSRPTAVSSRGTTGGSEGGGRV